MKRVGPQLFEELRKTATYISVAWKVTRKDGLVLGFTNADIPFTYEGVEYSPTNAFSATAAVSKSNFSVDNVNAVALVGPEITKTSLMAGKWSDAKVEIFWIKADEPHLGIVPIRGGTLGEITVNDGSFETELRSAIQVLQQDFGEVYTLDCAASLGDDRCKVVLDAPVWTPDTYVLCKQPGEAGVGAIFAPTVENGFWYEAVDGHGTVSSAETQAEPGLQVVLNEYRRKHGITH